MNQTSRALLTVEPELPPVLGTIMSMLGNSRASLIESVHDLSAEQLSVQFDAKANPIGSLLGHIAAIEWFYCTVSAEDRQPTADEWARWGALLRLSPATWEATKGQPLELHLEQLNAVRAATVAALSRHTDAWLLEPIQLMWLPDPSNHLWVWYHVLEDELNHRGQIRWLKSRL